MPTYLFICGTSQNGRKHMPTKGGKGFYQTLDDAIYAKLKEKAKKKGLTLQELIRSVVADYLEKGE
jgi:hypothetical protein